MSEYNPVTKQIICLRKLVEKLDRIGAITGRLHEKSPVRRDILECTPGIQDDLTELRDLHIEVSLMLVNKSMRIERLIHALVKAGIEVPR